MPEDIESFKMSEILTFEEIISIVTEAAKLGIKKIKITGGEPLVRRGACDLIRMIKRIPGIEQVTLTTNGVLLKDNLAEIKDAGIDGINISIDTPDRERYRSLTGRDELDRVLEGLWAALQSGIKIKINSVCPDIDGSQDLSDVFSMIGFAKDNPVDVRFIEMMPIGFGKDFRAIGHDILIPAIRERYPDMTKDNESHGNGPAVYYRIPGYKGSVGFISAIHGVFCQSCNRVRLTTLGYMKSCLCFETGVDLKSIIRSGLSEEDKKKALRAGIEEAILCKPAQHSFDNLKRISEKHVMAAIGG